MRIIKALTLAFAMPFTPVLGSEPFDASAFQDYEPDAERGQSLYNAAGCAACHAIDGDDDVLAGGMEFKTRFGTLYAPNITAHPDAGIGSWSNAQFLNAVLRGVKPEGGSYLGAVFPFPAYSRMQPEDALDIRGYMATLPQSDAASRPHRANMLDQLILGFWSDLRSPLESLDHNQMARGQYLVQALGHCGECHSRRAGTLANRMDPEGAFMGETGMLGEYAGPIGATRLANFAPEDFVNGAMVEGLRLSGTPMVSTTMRRIARATAQLPHEDRVAMYAFLSGTPIDPATVPRMMSPAPMTTETRLAQAVTAPAATGAAPGAESAESVIPDRTGALALIQRIEAYCEAPEPTPAAVPVVPASAAPSMDPALEAAADDILEQHCRSCHGPGMTNQRSFFTGSLQELARDRGAVIPGDHRASLLYDTIASNRMPTGRLPRLTPDELQTLVSWIDGLGAVAEPVPAIASAPAVAQVSDASELPRFVGGSFVDLATAAVRDLGEFDEFDRRFIRYLSFANVPLPRVDCDAQGALRNPMHYLHTGLNKFLNSVSRASVLRMVDPVEGTDGALVRIDLRSYDWTADDWDALTLAKFTDGAAEAGYSPQIWAELAPRYPYAIDPSSESLLGVLSSGTTALVPIMGADWFTRFASEAPFYDMLLRLPDDVAVLERRLGLNVNQLIGDLRMVRAGFTAQNSGVSDHNRMLERFDLPRGGYYWKSYDFAGDVGRQSLILHPDGPEELGYTPSGTQAFEHDGGEMIFSLANGMQGYYLSEADGRRLSEGPTAIVSFRERPVGKGVEIVNARSCFTCHDNGIIPKRDEIRGFIESDPRYDQRTRDVLLRMYPQQSVMDGYYRADTDFFVQALQQINATQSSVAGRPVSLIAPDGSGEIITFLADVQFRRMDEGWLARLFYLEPEELRLRVRQMGDPVLQQTLQGWLTRFDMGQFVTREEVEELWPALLPRLTRLRPYVPVDDYIAYEPPKPAEDYAQAAVTAVQEAVYLDTTAYQVAQDIPAYVPPAQPDDPLRLRLHVPRQRVQVNELLTFEVEANRTCELQIVYIEVNDRIVVLPTEVLGNPVLQAGERRLVPQPQSSLQLRFDRPGSGEKLLAYCREPGSRQPPMDAAELVAASRARFQPLERGIVIEASKAVLADEGRSAFASVTIDVIKH
ncbi:c-type cytochrome [Natronohydrobacter thiooxidans]|jgi:mono/diheme cytochrome c family protein|uniref:c-type cytochrome n=1 Tax=Natronohydrobacter thiooxidans TaxID=87172 RepID=UPI0008FF45EC|nr:c-type cytochrome [Natronohydrobacter thiooxidans]